MGEGLGPTEVAHELERDHGESRPDVTGRERWLVIFEASLLALVAMLAAWSGFAAAKWSTESRLELAQASATRTEASRANLTAHENRNFDSVTFNAWLAAYASGNQVAIDITERRFRPEFKVAFDAWMRTDPFGAGTTPGPTYQAEYVQPEAVRAAELDRVADERYAAGAEAAYHADGYVRTTVFLATVLFLVGISRHFRLAAARIGLIVVATGILGFSVFLLIVAPAPPA